MFLSGQDIVKFQCESETDPGSQLVIKWYRGQTQRPITTEKNRIYIDEDNSLVLNLTNEEDSGRSFIATYTCVATNGVTWVNSSARLRPMTESPPEGVVGSLLAINGPFPSGVVTL